MTVVIATASVEDTEQLDALLTRCSLGTRNSRFFGPAQRWPSVYRTGMVAGDPSRHDAVVARVLAADRIVGVASVVAGPDIPELAALVEDRWQRQGVGTAMVTALLARARQRGVPYLRAIVLPGSSRLLTRLGDALAWERSETIGHALSGVYRL